MKETWRTEKRFLSLLLAMAVMMGLFSGITVVNSVSSEAANETNVKSTAINYQEASYSEGEVKYTEKSVTDYTVVGCSTTAWNGDMTGGFYVVNADTTMEGRVTVTGNVKLILCDGYTLSAINGITVSDGNSLTIYAQTEGSGQLNAKKSVPNDTAGIGGLSGEDGGTIIICGGTVNASGGWDEGAGIGGGKNGGAGSVKIYGGNVTATGSIYASGIGSGYGKASGSVDIYGGNIYAYGGGDKDTYDYRRGGAGIGGGFNSTTNDGTYSIYGGTVTVKGGYNAAGIGGAHQQAGGTIIIKGGNVTANAWNYGAGIGGGNGGSGGTITIDGGTVNASGDDSGAGIGGGNGGSGGTITINNGNITVTGGYAGAGIGGGNGGSGGTIIINDGDITATGGMRAAGIGGGKEGSGGTISINGGTVNATTTADDYAVNGAGIGGGYNGSGGTITINECDVTATGGEFAAGIGGGCDGGGGTINISESTVNATGQGRDNSYHKGGGSGIGGGIRGSGGEITIVDSNVTAIGGAYSAGIGGGGVAKANSTEGTSGTGGVVSVTGGTVLAQGKNGGMGIGAGYNNSSHNTLTISSNRYLFGKSDGWPECNSSYQITDGTRMAYMVISKITPTVTAPTAKKLTYTGSAQELVNAGSTTGGTLYYAVTTENTAPDSSAYTTSIPTGTDAGTYYVWYKVVGDSNYNDTDPVSVEITMKASKDTQTITASDVTATYGDTDKSVSATTDGNGAISYAVTSGDAVTVDNSTGALTIVKAGTATVTVTATETDDYAAATKDVSVTVSKAAATVTTPPATVSGLSYNTSSQELVTAGAASGGVMQYATGTDQSAAPTTGWSTSLPTATNAGTYYVWYKAEGDDNHSSSTPAVTAAITIAKIDPTPDAVSGLKGYYGQTLSAVALPMGWSWADSTCVLDDIGNHNFYAIYTPSDTTNYNTLEGQILNVEVAAADKTALTTAINEAQTYYDSIKDYNTYQSVADTLKTAIETAQEVQNKDNPTQDEVTNAATSVNSAKTTAENSVKDIDDTIAAQAVIDQINALPERKAISQSDREAVEAARASYSALTEDQKAKVGEDVLWRLTEAEKGLEENVGYQDVPPDPGVIHDITGIAVAKAETNPYFARIDNTNLQSLFNVSDAEATSGVNVWVDVQNNTSISASDKSKMTAVLDGYVEGQYLNVTMFKKIGNGAKQQVTNTNGKTKITFSIPEALRKSGRKYMMVKLHDGVATTIEGDLNESTFEFTFESGEFSPYMIAYKDVAEETSSSSSSSTEDTSSSVSSTAATTSTTKVTTKVTTKTTTKSPKTRESSIPVKWYMLLALTCVLIILGKKRRED